MRISDRANSSDSQSQRGSLEEDECASTRAVWTRLATGLAARTAMRSNAPGLDRCLASKPDFGCQARQFYKASVAASDALAQEALVRAADVTAPDCTRCFGSAGQTLSTRPSKGALPTARPVCIPSGLTWAACPAADGL